MPPARCGICKHLDAFLFNGGATRSRTELSGFAIRYIPTSVRQEHGDDSASLVRGVDDYRTFEHEPRPSKDMDPAFVSLHAEIAQRNAQILYKGAPISKHEQRLQLQP